VSELYLVETLSIHPLIKRVWSSLLINYEASFGRDEPMVENTKKLNEYSRKLQFDICTEFQSQDRIHDAVSSSVYKIDGQLAEYYNSVKHNIFLLIGTNP
jgi:hypothetical protein